MGAETFALSHSDSKLKDAEKLGVKAENFIITKDDAVSVSTYSTFVVGPLPGAGLRPPLSSTTSRWTSSSARPPTFSRSSLSTSRYSSRFRAVIIRGLPDLPADAPSRGHARPPWSPRGQASVLLRPGLGWQEPCPCRQSHRRHSRDQVRCSIS